MISGERMASALQGIPYSVHLGIRFDAASQHFLLPFRDDLIGNAQLPAIHGGVVGGYLESVAILWLLVTEAQQRIPKPIDFSVDFLRSARAQDCHASCEVLRQGRRVAQAQVRCWQADFDRPVAVGRGHFLLETAADR